MLHKNMSDVRYFMRLPRAIPKDSLAQKHYTEKNSAFSSEKDNLTGNEPIFFISYLYVA